MGRLQKTSDQVNLSIFDTLAQEHVNIEDREPEMKSRTEKQSAFDRSFEEMADSPKLSHSSIDEVDLVRGRHSIRSAACGNISDEGSSNNAYGVAGKNSVFDPNLLDRLGQVESARERTEAEKASSHAVRAAKQAEYRSQMSPQVGESDESYIGRQASSVVSNSQTAHRHGWVPNGSISIFDAKDFERVQPTQGESMEKKAAADDKSWQQIKKASTTKEAASGLFDKLAAEDDSANHKNTQKESTDRLFDILQSRMGTEGE